MPFDLDVLGAALRSTGSVAFDNSQFPPIPVGSDRVLTVKGAYALLDALSAAAISYLSSNRSLHVV